MAIIQTHRMFWNRQKLFYLLVHLNILQNVVPPLFGLGMGCSRKPSKKLIFSQKPGDKAMKFRYFSPFETLNFMGFFRPIFWNLGGIFDFFGALFVVLFFVSHNKCIVEFRNATVFIIKMSNGHSENHQISWSFYCTQPITKRGKILHSAFFNGFLRKSSSFTDKERKNFLTFSQCFHLRTSFWQRNVYLWMFKGPLLPLYYPIANHSKS